MIVQWTERAAGELEHHYDYYRAHNPTAARQVRRLIIAGANRLHDYPRMGKPGQVEGTRNLTIAGTPFVLVYRENPARVEILHCYHGRQNWQEADE